MDMSQLQSIPLPMLYLFFAWALLWKGLALWHAARYTQRNWFIAVLIINSLGILEIIYLFVFAKQKMKIADLMFWKKL